jgi:hypothetical protein
MRLNFVNRATQPSACASNQSTRARQRYCDIIDLQKGHWFDSVAVRGPRKAGRGQISNTPLTCYHDRHDCYGEGRGLNDLWNQIHCEMSEVSKYNGHGLARYYLWLLDVLGGNFYFCGT